MADQAVADQADQVEDAGEASSSGKSSSKKLVLFVFLLILLLAGGGAGAFFAGLLDPLLGKSAEHVKEEAAGAPVIAAISRAN